MILYSSDIEVELASTDISVSESDVSARVCVVITDGVLAINVAVLLTTQDDSATGTCDVSGYVLNH